jgi:excinuclease ABC subunit B
MAKRIKAVEKEMCTHADGLEFEKAAAMRDRIKEFQGPGLVA